MYHGWKVIARNRIRWLPMAAILDSEITKMPSGYNHYTHLILKLHGIENPKMQKNDCYHTLQGSTTVPVDYNIVTSQQFSNVKSHGLHGNSSAGSGWQHIKHNSAVLLALYGVISVTCRPGGDGWMGGVVGGSVELIKPLHVNFFRGSKTYIYILYHSSTLTWHR